MKLNPKLTGGLAWAGLIVVLAVPGADMLTKPQSETATRVTPQIDQTQTATITAQPAAATNGNDAVDSFLSSGKKLPSYISDAPADVASAKPATTTKLVVPSEPATSGPATKAPVEVAALPSAAPQVAPKPYPASLRPAAPASPASVAPVVTASVSEEAPLIVDEDLVARREAAVEQVLEQTPVQTARPPQSTAVVTGDELEEWDSGSLADYLERRNLISNGNSQASNSDFDDDGFFLDEGPNEDRSRARVIRRLPRNSDFFLF